MKKSIHIAISAALFMSAGSLFATEALSPIAYGAKARGMGGVGIATFQGAESGLINPALIAYGEKNEATLGMSYLLSDGTYSFNSVSTDIDSEAAIIPYAVLSDKVNDNFSWGAGITTFSGLNSSVYLSGNYLILSDVSKTRITVPFAYTIAGFSVGIAPLFEQQSAALMGMASPTSGGFGFDFGLAYMFGDMGLTLAMDYKFKIDHEHKFDATGTPLPISINTPSELGFGVSWDIFKSGHTVGIDYKRINASDIFEIPGGGMTMEDQDVFALGYAYKADTWALRAGYCYVSDLYDLDNAAELVVYMPYNTTSHFTLGGSYRFNEMLSGDLALVYGSDNKSYTAGAGIVEIEDDQTSATIGVNYLF